MSEWSTRLHEWQASIILVYVLTILDALLDQEARAVPRRVPARRAISLRGDTVVELREHVIRAVEDILLLFDREPRLPLVEVPVQPTMCATNVRIRFQGVKRGQDARTFRGLRP